MNLEYKKGMVFMSRKQITQGSIAIELNLSRNTVSKVLNNAPGPTDRVRELVIQKADELGYSHTGLRSLDRDFKVNEKYNTYNITLLCKDDSFSSSFWTKILRGIENSISQSHNSLQFVMIQKSQEEEETIPTTFRVKKPDGLIVLGLFSKAYYQKLKSLNIPMITYDIHKDLYEPNLFCDIVMVENYLGTYITTSNLIKKGHKEISFVGDINSCLSFYERWNGFKNAMIDNGLNPFGDYNMTTHSEYDYYNFDEIFSKIKNILKLPTAFVCANDDMVKSFIYMKNSLRFLSDMTDIAGFDKSIDDFYLTAQYSTVEIFTEEIGKILGEQIIWRIENPGRCLRCIRIPVKVIQR